MCKKPKSTQKDGLHVMHEVEVPQNGNGVECTASTDEPKPTEAVHAIVELHNNSGEEELLSASESRSSLGETYKFGDDSGSEYEAYDDEHFAPVHVLESERTLIAAGYIDDVILQRHVPPSRSLTDNGMDFDESPVFSMMRSHYVHAPTGPDTRVH